MAFGKKKKKTVVLIICLAIIILITVGGLVFFLAKNSASKSKLISESQWELEEKKFRLAVVYNFPNFRECRFLNSMNKGFKISLDHPALKGIELKVKSWYLVEGIKTPLEFGSNRTKIDMSDKITITLL